MNNVFRWASLVGVLMAFICGLWLPQMAEARSSQSHELNYFQTSKVKIAGASALRIEIGMTGEEPKYTVKDSLLRKQVVITLPETRRGKVKEQVKLNNDLAKHVKIMEVEGSTQVIIDCVNTPVDGNYRVTTAPAERRLNKPARIIVEIFENGAAMDAVPGIKGKTIVIDPGHGGSDTGAIGPTGVKEKDVCLAVSKKVESLLASSGARVIMTRSRDVDVYAPNATDKQELQARCNVGNRDPRAALFVSIHCNAFSNPAANGMETYYCAGSQKGYEAANFINEELAKAGGLFNRGVKTANYYVLRHTSMPATLLELGFVTNYREEKLLRSDAYQTKLANAIVRGIARYFKG
ncbi:N-acetylmuramoyl-L-alanine amidase [Selenomonas sp. FC4001]|uniref:N-acetylmuramoyl-L-alanine amidase family protein n=1 Tax=Selenomonas sp. FC4001 TaxID=1408313 RepID=UPI00056AD9C4|nr:N-acetylmuramoyl-L-alanine amidase [Selenomonas sp. FC4001]